MDAHQALRVQPSTLQGYRQAAAPFSLWLRELGARPEGAGEWDDLLVEFKNESDLSQAKLSQLVCAIEFVYPRLRSELRWSHAVLAGMAISHFPRHTVPLGKGHAQLLGSHVVSLGHPRMGLGIAVQQCLGLRPSELLQLHPQDLQFSDECGDISPHASGGGIGDAQGDQSQKTTVRHFAPQRAAAFDSVAQTPQRQHVAGGPFVSLQYGAVPQTDPAC